MKYLQMHDVEYISISHCKQDNPFQHYKLHSLAEYNIVSSLIHNIYYRYTIHNILYIIYST